MRLGLVLGVAGFLLCSGVSAQAQTYYQSGGAPVYVPSNSGQAYTTGDGGIVPFYNNAAQPLPMDQMVAGKNAPSYNFGGNTTKPYTFNSGSSNSGALSPNDIMQMRADRDARAQQYEKQYMQATAQTQQGQAANGALSNLMPQQQPKPRVTKRLVNRPENNPLAAPPRLFNPDQ